VRQNQQRTTRPEGAFGVRQLAAAFSVARFPFTRFPFSNTGFQRETGNWKLKSGSKPPHSKGEILHGIVRLYSSNSDQ
jgi:hypothetical protein